jgi:glycosyltransferase involved in cell wall biosynthesis
MNVVAAIVKEEEFYIPLMIQSVINHANLVILDTGSTDGTVEIIKSFQERYPSKIMLIENDFGSNDYAGDEFRFARGFRQNDARDSLTMLAEHRCTPEDWIICLDGDEVVNERFWEVLDECSPEEDAVFHATDLPVTPSLISTHPLDTQQWNGFKMFDPHIRAWRVRTGARWHFRTGLDAHPVLRWKYEPKVKATEDNVHFHLHYSFGPKSIYSYMVTTEQTTQGAAKILDMPLKEMHNQKYFEERWPEWFEDGRFIPKRGVESILWSKHSRFLKPASHPIPDFVAKAWEKWGSYVEPSC